ncbi:MAG: hypothetical protein AAGK66_02960 [Pseudomonadota bacterium]
MKYVRFQSQLDCKGTASKLGVFQIAYRVRDAHETSVHDANEITKHMDWLETHLNVPDLTNETYRAIFWFKETAHEPMKRVWAMKPYLEAYGYWIDLVTSRDPGRLIYQDGWQVAAKPW